MARRNHRIVRQQIQKTAGMRQQTLTTEVTAAKRSGKNEIARNQ